MNRSHSENASSHVVTPRRGVRAAGRQDRVLGELWPPCVLMVDDDEDARSELAERLRTSRCDVVECASTIELEEHVASFVLFGRYYPPPDLLIASTRLPGFGDVGLVEGLRRLRERAPVVLTRVLPRDAALLRVIGPQAAFTEPTDVERVRRSVLDLIPARVWQRAGMFF